MVGFLLRLRRRFLLRWERAFSRAVGTRSVMIFLAMFIGVAAAAAAALMHAIVHSLETWGFSLEESRNLWFTGLFFVLPFLGILLSFMLQRAFGGARYAKSLSPLILSLNRRKTSIPVSEMWTHLLSSAISVGCGGSAGLEAPSVLTGAAIGANTSRLLGMDRRQKLLLIGCGGAAAISAIFQSPIGGVLFAVEVLLPEFSAGALVPLLISSAVAMVTSRALFPHEQILWTIDVQWRTDAIPFYFLCAFLCAFSGIFMIRTAYFLTAKLKKHFVTRLSRMIFGGAALTILLAIFPLLRGQGYFFISRLFQGDLKALTESAPLFAKLPLPAAAALLIGAAILLKAVASVLTVESGGDGGIFAPTMFVGAFTGFAFARLVNLTGIIELQELNFVVAGICGVFTAVMRAPLTGIFLIAEVTQSYILLVPMMIVSSVSLLVAHHFEPHSIYRKALAEAGLLAEDRDHSMLQRLSVRLCIRNDWTPLNIQKPLAEILELVAPNTSKAIFPVLDEEGKLCGIVRTEKLLPLMLAPGLAHSLLIFDLMEKPRGEITMDDDLSRAVENLERFHLSYLPVRDNTGRFAGFVAKTDIFNLYRSLIRDADSY